MRPRTTLTIPVFLTEAVDQSKWYSVAQEEWLARYRGQMSIEVATHNYWSQKQNPSRVHARWQWKAEGRFSAP
ncbi:MAG: hypothetical protein ACREN5_06275 [Gemmatimonadales bacterium]